MAKIQAQPSGQTNLKKHRQRAKARSSRHEDWRYAVWQLDSALAPSHVRHVRQGFGRFARAKQWLQSRVLLHKALKTTVQLDVAAYNSVASACNGARRSLMAWRVARRNLGLIRQAGMEVDMFSYGIAAVTCSASPGFSLGLWSQAYSLLKTASMTSVRLSAVAWSSILDTSSKAGRWEDTALLLQAMECGTGPVPDTHCVNVLMSAVAWQLGLDIFSKATTSVGVDEVSFNSALALLEGRSSADGVWSLVSMMRKTRIRPSQVTYGTASRVFGVSSLWSCAVQALRFGSLSGVAPNIIACGAAVDACQRSGAWTMAWMLLQEISTIQLQTNAPACGAAITAAGNCQQWSHTLALLSQVAKMSIPTTAPTIGAAMSACQGAVDLTTGSWQQVLDFLRLGSDLQMLGSGVSACSKGQQWDHALALLASSTFWRLQPSLTVVNSALDGLDRAGLWAEAADLLASFSPSTKLDSLSLRSIMQATEVGGGTGQNLDNNSSKTR